MPNTDTIILVDIDGTLTAGDIFTQPGDSLLWGNGVLHLIAEHHARHHSLELRESQQRLRAYADEVIWWDYPDFIRDFDVPAEPILADLTAFHATCIQPRPGAVEVMEALAEAGHTLCIMSNNPVTGSLLKLQAIGLSDGRTAPLFRQILGSNNLRGQKSLPAMWQRAIEQLGVPPASLTTIGDNPLEDGHVPRSLGVARTCIIPLKPSDPPVPDQLSSLHDVLPILVKP